MSALLACPDEVILSIFDHLIPDWESINRELARKFMLGHQPIDLSSVPYDPARLNLAKYKASLLDLSILNRTCRRLHVLTCPMLWRSVSWTNAYPWMKLDPARVTMIQTIWLFNISPRHPSFKPMVKHDQAFLERFSHARIAEMHMPSNEPRGWLTVRIMPSVHIVLPSGQQGRWLWTSNRASPMIVHTIHLCCASAASPIPTWIVPLSITTWKVQYRILQEPLRIPENLPNLPVSGTRDGSVVITWASKDKRTLEEILKDITVQVKSWPSAPKDIGWKAVTLRVTTKQIGDKDHATVSAEVKTATAEALREWASSRIPYANFALNIFDRTGGQALAKFAVPPRLQHMHDDDEEDPDFEML